MNVFIFFSNHILQQRITTPHWLGIRLKITLRRASRISYLYLLLSHRTYHVTLVKYLFQEGLTLSKGWGEFHFSTADTEGGLTQIYSVKRVFSVDANTCLNPRHGLQFCTAAHSLSPALSTLSSALEIFIFPACREVATGICLQISKPTLVNQHNTKHIYAGFTHSSPYF